MNALPGSEGPEKMDTDNSDQELTNKFLSGEMSFAEYSNEWYYEDEDEDAEGGKQMDVDVQQPIFGRKKRIRPSKHNLSAALLGLMGEANLRFVRGDKDMAEKMCHEIIKQLPTAPEPYQTLAQIYEHDSEKSLQFSLLAAHLSPPDANEWIRLAHISKQRNDVKQEMMCYTQAIKAEPQNLELHMKRLNLLASLEETKFPIHSLCITPVKCYQKIVTSLPSSESETIMKYARKAATIYHNSQEIEKAMEVMTAAYKKCAADFTLADTNIYLELLIDRKQYQACIDLFITNLGVDIEAEIQTLENASGEIEEQTNYLNCTIPNNLPVDLKSKLLICFIHLKAISLVQTLLNDFFANEVEKAGDLYMDIEEALSSVGQHELALMILERLVKNSNFDLAAVWLKHADCLYNLGREDEAVQSYHRVLKDAPQHCEARKRLYLILEKQGRIDEALDILQQDYKFEVSAKLLYEQCLALKKYNRMEKYLEVGEALLSKTFIKYRHMEELKLAFVLKSTVDVIHKFRTARGENPYNDDEIHFDENETFKLTPDEEWDFFKELLSIAHKNKQYHAMQRLAFGSIMSKSIVSSHRPQIEFYCLQACLLANDYQNALRLIRDHNHRYTSTRSWNLLNLVLHSVEESTHVKFLTRLFQKEHSTLLVKNLFLGNNFLYSGRYLVALKYFLKYHEQSKEPISALLIAITMLVMAAQRTVDKHHSLVLQGMCYLLTYANLRKCDQETNYNLGRAYQVLSINNLAIEYYERALASGPITTCPQHGVIDLTKEIAYNLYILYKDHSPHTARNYMLKYLVIE